MVHNRTMSNDDRFRPDGTWQPDQHGEGGPNPPERAGGVPPPNSPYTGQNYSPQASSGQSGWSGQDPRAGHGPSGWPGQPSGIDPQTGQFANQPPGSYPPQGQHGGYPGGPGGPGGYPPVMQPRRGRGRSIAIIAVLLVIVLVLIGLGVWWWLGRSDAADSADGADSATAGAELFVERFNGEDFSEIYESVSPAEQQYASAMTTLLMRHSWESGGVDLDEEEAREEFFDALGRYSEVADYELRFDATDEVVLTDTMTAVVVTEGTSSLEITDIDGFADITGDLLENMYTEEQIRRNFAVSSVQELKTMIADELRASDQTEFSTDFTQENPMILVMVEEELGWYVSPVSSAAAYMNLDYFTDERARDLVIQRNGEFTLATPEKADSPEAAAENFVDALANEPITDALGYLPLTEQRGLGLLLYLADMPEVQDISFGELLTLSNFTTTTIEVSDHSALTVFEAFQINVNPALAGQAMEILLEDGQMTIGTCAPVDVSILLDEDAPVLAFSVVDDESGWNVSLVGTALNAAAAGTTAEENMDEFAEVGDELSRCLG